MILIVRKLYIVRRISEDVGGEKLSGSVVDEGRSATHSYVAERETISTIFCIF